MRPTSWAGLALGGLILCSGRADAQEPRLAGRLPATARLQVEAIIDSARADGLPADPLVARALEGSTKGAPPGVIVAAVVRLRNELREVRAAFGDLALPSELSAGASALRAGATGDDLVQLRSLRPDQPLTIAAAVLADLVATGVPADTAVQAVLALAARAADADYIAFRRNVQRDISQGASPAAALGVRLRALDDLAQSEPGPGTARPPRKQKP